MAENIPATTRSKTTYLLTTVAVCIGAGVGALRSRKWAVLGGAIGGSVPLGCFLWTQAPRETTIRAPTTERLSVIDLSTQEQTQAPPLTRSEPDHPPSSDSLDPTKRCLQGELRISKYNSCLLHADGRFELYETTRDENGRRFERDPRAFYVLAELKAEERLKELLRARQLPDRDVCFPSFVFSNRGLRLREVRYREQGQRVSLTWKACRGISFPKAFQGQKNDAIWRANTGDNPYLFREDIPGADLSICDVPVSAKQLFCYQLTDAHCKQLAPITPQIVSDVSRLQGLPNYRGEYKPGLVFESDRLHPPVLKDRQPIPIMRQGISRQTGKLIVRAHVCGFEPGDITIVIHAGRPSCLFLYATVQVDVEPNAVWISKEKPLYLTPYLLRTPVDPTTVYASLHAGILHLTMAPQTD